MYPASIKLWDDSLILIPFLGVTLDQGFLSYQSEVRSQKAEIEVRGFALEIRGVTKIRQIKATAIIFIGVDPSRLGENGAVSGDWEQIYVVGAVGGGRRKDGGGGAAAHNDISGSRRERNTTAVCLVSISSGGA